jgi:hypothetical protein
MGMNNLMEDSRVGEEQLKFMINSSLDRQVREVFDSQGLNIKEGMSRLIEFLVTRPKELHPLILKQLPGNSAEIVTRAILEQLSGEKSGDRGHHANITHSQGLAAAHEALAGDKARSVKTKGSPRAKDGNE